MNSAKPFSEISKRTLQRLPYYLDFLKTKCSEVQYVSAPTIAKEMGLNEVQVRKDLASVSVGSGKPRTGFAVEELLRDIEKILGYECQCGAILVGVGQLGRALLSYRGFEKYGTSIEAAFDSNQELIGTEICGKPVHSVKELGTVCKEKDIHIGIITVPAAHAQSICDMMVASGIHAILNFAPVRLKVSDDILVQNENLAASLALLSQHLQERE